jgi:CarD family transcriptional regulator
VAQASISLFLNLGVTRVMGSQKSAAAVRISTPVTGRPSLRRSPFAKKRSFAKKSAMKSTNETPDHFEAGQKVVYPGHGVGQIQAIESKEISGVTVSFYMIRILENDITVMVPVNKVEGVGVRPIASSEDVQKVYQMMRERTVVVEQTTWNRRYREYMEKVKTGSIFEIAEVLRDLCVIRGDKVLSFGERKMLELAKGLLVKELSIAEDSDEPTVEAQIEEIFAA